MKLIFLFLLFLAMMSHASPLPGDKTNLSVRNDNSDVIPDGTYSYIRDHPMGDHGNTSDIFGYLFKWFSSMASHDKADKS